MCAWGVVRERHSDLQSLKIPSSGLTGSEYDNQVVCTAAVLSSAGGLVLSEIFLMTLSSARAHGQLIRHQTACSPEHSFIKNAFIALLAHSGASVYVCAAGKKPHTAPEVTVWSAGPALLVIKS
jgi:hypothetical protein